MTKKIDMKDYQKPELTRIDDSAFEETGQGSSGFYPGGSNNGNHYGNNGNSNGGNNNGNHYGGGNGGGKSHK